MDILSNLKYALGSKKKRKRIGRGEGSGHGGTATRGENGQKSRAGFSRKLFFEGGQMPLQRRIPKRGFTNIFKKEFQLVNLDRLQKLIDDKKITVSDINASVLLEAGLISKIDVPVKILGDGELKSKINVTADAFSKSAKEKIESKGGSTKQNKD